MITARHPHISRTAATLNVIGDHWTMLILPEPFQSASKSSEIHRSTAAS